jgi:hypothetical protein
LQLRDDIARLLLPARAADLGPMLATEMSASKNSRSIAFEKPK